MPRRVTRREFIGTAVATTAIAGSGVWPPTIFAQSPPPNPMNTIAERYARLVLALGQHDADYVDAFYGPAEWKTEAERRKMPLKDIGAAADRLLADIPPSSDADRRDELAPLRHDYLKRQLEALRARVRMLEGTTLTF